MKPTFRPSSSDSKIHECSMAQNFLNRYSTIKERTKSFSQPQIKSSYIQRTKRYEYISDVETLYVVINTSIQTVTGTTVSEQAHLNWVNGFNASVWFLIEVLSTLFSRFHYCHFKTEPNEVVSSDLWISSPLAETIKPCKRVYNSISMRASHTYSSQSEATLFTTTT